MPSLGAVFSNIRRTLSELSERARLALRNVSLAIRRLVSPRG
jgi:hypothetical protein